jgi:hypothetical protein
MTMLSIIQSVTDRMGIPRPTSVIGSTDTQVRQLLALLNEEGEELSKKGDWQALTREQTFTTVAAPTQTATPIPDDLDRFIADSFFNRTQIRRLYGPVTPQEWQAYQAQPAYNLIYLAFRERDGAFLITPTPPAGDTIAYEYVSKDWAVSSTFVAKDSFTADDDTSYLPDMLLKAGLRWRWKQAKGLPYGEDMETYERAVQRELGNDGGSGSLDITGESFHYPFGVNLPEGGFGLP